MKDSSIISFSFSVMPTLHKPRKYIKHTFLISSYIIATMGKAIVVLKKAKFEFDHPQSFITTTARHNSKYASRVYLPVDWEDKEVVVVLK